MAKKILIFAVIINLFAPALFSQHYFFRKYSVEEGLPQSSVYCILEDSRGFVWIGTDGGGLSRFDGIRFETFTMANGLSDNIIRTLFEDSKGNIWIGTGNGLTIYDGIKFRAVTKENGLRGKSVLRIIESMNSIIWAGTNDGGLSSIKLGDSLSIANFSREDGLISDFIYDIYEDSDKRLWLAMVGGVNILEFSQDDSLVLKSVERLRINSEFILSIEPSNDGTIWFGTHGDGLFKATPDMNKKKYVTEPSEINNIYPGLIVWDLESRNDGELWLATDKNGIIRLKDDKLAGQFCKDNGLPSNQILNITQDLEGNSWFSSFGQGAIMFGDDKFLAYGSAEGIKGSQVLSLFFGSDNMFYAATEEGFACYEQAGEKIKMRSFFSSGNGLNDPVANAIAKFDSGIWIGTNSGINIYDGTRLLKFRLNDQLPDKKINTLFTDSKNNLWIGTSGGYSKYSAGRMYSLSQSEGLIHDEIQTIIEDTRGRIWVGTVGGLVKLEGSTYTDYNAEDGLSFLRINSLAEDPAGNIWIGTFGGGIFKFDVTSDSVPISLLATKKTISSSTINSIVFISKTRAIVTTDKGFDLIELNDRQSIEKVISYGIKDGFTGGENNPNSIAKDKNGFIWFGTKNGLIRFNPPVGKNYPSPPETYITGIKLFFEDVNWESRHFLISKWNGLPENLVLSHKDNHITFAFTGPSFSNPDDLEFSYYLENQSKEWSPFNRNREVVFSGLIPGNYIFKIKARNKFGFVGDAANFKFVINPPFWQTTWFLMAASILIIFLIIMVIRIRERNLIREKVKLENIVKERTREVVEQKDEIVRQRDVVTFQKKEITDSIQYAKRIQQAVLPDEKILNKFFSDYFIILIPKDIVSGDFYWMTEKSNHIVFTAADCTGHGVPGALMSMFGVSFLNKIVSESGIVKPSAILTSLRGNVISSLKQEEALKSTKDGMDIALCSIDIKKMKLYFSGANNPIYIFRKEKDEYVLIEKKGDRMPIGFYSIMSDFTNHELDIQKGDTIYLFSDGFIDQFGGPEGRKFMVPQFKKMLLDNQGLDMASQKTVFLNTLNGWINYPSNNNLRHEQVDDIVILGLKI